MIGLALFVALFQVDVRPQGLPDGYANWDGFKYLGGQTGAVEPVPSRPPRQIPGVAASADAPTFRIKAFVFTRESRVDRMPNEVLRPSHYTLSETDLARAHEAIAASSTSWEVTPRAPASRERSCPEARTGRSFAPTAR